MSNVSVVLGEIYGDVSYGIDYKQFIIGVYPSQEEAEQKILELQESTDVIIINNGRILVNDIYGDLSLMTEKEFLEDREYATVYIEDESERTKYFDPYANAKRYKDLRYRIIIVDNNKPVFSAKARYEE